MIDGGWGFEEVGGSGGDGSADEEEEEDAMAMAMAGFEEDLPSPMKPLLFPPKNSISDGILASIQMA